MTEHSRETATFGGGCFWCLDAVFRQLNGVEKVVSGYAGGRTRNPSYKLVTTGTTGHAEVVDVTFDPAKITRDQLLDVFFTIHDPTTLNRQGNDVGSQYRSAVFYHSAAQKAAAEAKIAEIDRAAIWGKRAVTEVVPATTFYVAEDYHQEYFARTGNANPYCSVVIAPKVAKFRKRFANLLKR